jgi:hypothetical protein
MEFADLVLAVAPLLLECSKLAKLCHEVQTKYQSAPGTLASIITECNGVSHILVEVQYLGLQDIASLDAERRQSFRDAIDSFVVGCTNTLSIIEQHVEGFRHSADGVVVRPMHRLGRRDKMKIVWNEEDINQLLQRLRGYQTDLTLPLSILHMWVVPQNSGFLSRSLTRHSASGNPIMACVN